MKTKTLFILSLIILVFSSCIKDEIMFKEADIEKFSLDHKLMEDVLYGDSTIIVAVSDTTGLSSIKFAPTIDLSFGATASPASGEPINIINNTATYKVTSEDGKKTKIYTVMLQMLTVESGFEDWTTDKYLGKTFVTPTDMTWSSANAGVAMKYKPEDLENAIYPTRFTTDSYSGKHAALLETQKGAVIFSIDIPIFAGSLFRGEFKANISAPIKSARFGRMHPEYLGKPITFKGYYKYSPGPVFTDENKNPVSGKVDELDIYAVIFKVTKGQAGLNEYLDGTNIKTSDKVVGKAILKDTSTKENYTPFSLPFEYTEELDFEKHAYKLAVVFSSSSDGDNYRGAIGSRLYIDDIEVLYEKIK